MLPINYLHSIICGSVPPFHFDTFISFYKTLYLPNRLHVVKLQCFPKPGNSIFENSFRSCSTFPFAIMSGVFYVQSVILYLTVHHSVCYL